METVNLHEILVRVETIARNSFGKHVVFERRYDPSLPEAWGDKDRLVQVLLNIIKMRARQQTTLTLQPLS